MMLNYTEVSINSWNQRIGKHYKKNKMRKKYTKPTIEEVPMNMGNPLLTGSNEKGINATISGYQSSDDDDDSDGFSQKSLWN